MKDYINIGLKMELKMNFKNNKFDGLRQIYFQNGELWIKVNYVDGIKNGLEQVYNSDGILFQEVNYKQEGLYKLYSKNENINLEYNYINDKKKRIMYEDGNLVKSLIYSNDYVI